MIILYFVNLLLAFLFSLGALTLVLTLAFKDQWKVIAGLVLSTAIFLTALSLAYKASSYREDGVEFSRMVQQANLFFQKRNR